MNGWQPMDEEARLGRAVEPDAIALSDTELREAASCVDLQQAKEKPDLAWTRYLRAMALIALRRWLKERRAEVTVGPELEPEAPDRLLALNGRATQLLCCTPLNEEVEVPLAVWQQSETAPQLLLLAEVDEDNGLVRFPGVLAAAAFAHLAQGIGCERKDVVQLPLEHFRGGLERLWRWVDLISKECIPRIQINQEQLENASGILKRARDLIESLLDTHRHQTMLAMAMVSRGTPRAQARLINPLTGLNDLGVLEAFAATPAPTLWSLDPLSDVQIWDGDSLLWRMQGESNMPITGPIAWPLPPIMPGIKLRVRLRVHGAGGGDYTEISVSTMLSREWDAGDVELNCELCDESLARISEWKLIGDSKRFVAMELAARLQRHILDTTDLVF